MMENFVRKFDEILNLNFFLILFGMFSSNKFVSRVIMVWEEHLLILLYERKFIHFSFCTIQYAAVAYRDIVGALKSL